MRGAIGDARCVGLTIDYESPDGPPPDARHPGRCPMKQKGLVYEPKYDGIRALAEIAPGREGPAQVRFWSRNGNEKTVQFRRSCAPS